MAPSYMLDHARMLLLSRDGSQPHEYLLILPAVISKHVVHLFQCLALRLRNEKQCPNTGKPTKEGEKDICPVTNRVKHRRSGNDQQ